MTTDYICYEARTLLIMQHRSLSLIDPASIIQITECEMADQCLHADEPCHLVCMRDHFWLVGPTVEGARDALSALLKDHPALRGERLTLERMPWKMRAPGLLGLRLWPMAGLGRYASAELRALHVKQAA